MRLGGRPHSYRAARLPSPIPTTPDLPPPVLFSCSSFSSSFLRYCCDVLDPSHPNPLTLLILTTFTTPCFSQSPSPLPSSIYLSSSRTSPRISQVPPPLGCVPCPPRPTRAILAAALVAWGIQQQRHQLGGVHGAEGERKVGSSDRWGAEEWWGHFHPLGTLTLLGRGQSLVRCQQHGGL